MNLIDDSTKPTAKQIEKMDTPKSKTLHSIFSVSSLLSSNSSSIKKTTEQLSTNDTSQTFTRESSSDSKLTLNPPKSIFYNQNNSPERPSRSFCHSDSQLASVTRSVNETSEGPCHKTNSSAAANLITVPKCLPAKYTCQKSNLETELSYVAMSMENMSSKDLLNKTIVEPKPEVVHWWNYQNVLYNRVHPYSAEAISKWEPSYDIQIPKIPMKNNVFCDFGWLNKYGLDDSLSRLSPSEPLQPGRSPLLHGPQNSLSTMWIPCLPCNPPPGTEASLNSK